MAAHPLAAFFEKQQREQRLALISLYDAPTARLACDSGADALLVGDSLGNVVLGYDSTIPVTLEDMCRHTGAVVRGVAASSRPETPVIADVPFGCCHGSIAEAVATCRALMHHGAHAVKVEGADATILQVIRQVTAMGAPVMGHLGFTPQSSLRLQGIVQGRTGATARALQREAFDLQEAGCFAVVLEATALETAAQITQDLHIPTIGIGAGPGCDGQVLVWHDLVGFNPAPPFRFVKQFAQVHETLQHATRQYIDEVHSGVFPATAHGWARQPEAAE